MEEELKRVLTIWFLILILGVALSLKDALGVIQFNGDTLDTEATALDSVSGMTIMSDRNVRLNTIYMDNRSTATTCYVYPNSTSLTYASPLATGSFSGFSCTISFNMTANVSYIVAADFPSGLYTAWYKNPSGVMPVSNSLITWYAGLFSNGAKTSWTFYPPAIIDIVSVDVTDLSPVVLEPNITSWSITVQSNSSILHSWTVTGDVVQVNLSRDGSVIYSTTDPDFFNITLQDANLTSCTTYAYSLLAYNSPDHQDQVNASATTFCNQPTPNSPTGIAVSIDNNGLIWLFLGFLFAEILLMFLSVYSRGFGAIFSAIGLLLSFFDFVFFLQIKDKLPIVTDNLVIGWGFTIGLLIVIPLAFIGVMLLQFFMVRRNVYKYQ